MDSIALTLIKENLKTKDPYLDLGNCGLRGDEPELELIGSLKHLDTLDFFNNKKSRASFYFRQANKGPQNNLKQIPKNLPPNIKTLFLEGNEIDWNLILYLDLKGLTSLHLYRIALSDTGGFSKFSNLKELYLYNTIVRESSIFSGLTSLTKLVLENVSIREIDCLSKLTTITDLTIDNGRLSDSAISSLPSLTGLKNLSLESNELTNIDCLSDLVGLTLLDASRNRLSKINLGSELIGLESLYLSDNQITEFTLRDIELIPNLQVLLIDGNPIRNIPREIFDKLLQNVLPDIKRYLGNIERGASQNNEVKVIFIGNGSVGKTQISKRIAEKEKFVFDANHHSTHAISLHQASLTSDIYRKELVLNLWDLGGQELFHATHRVFMRTRALIILVWDAENESKNFHTWEGKSYKNHRLRYWLAYSSLFAPKSPILVFENKVDDNSASDTLPNKEKQGLIKEFPNIVGFVYGSAKTGNNMGAIESKILNVLETHSMIHDEIFKAKLPTSWIAVRDQIRKLQQSKESVKELTKEDFQNFCRNEGIDPSTETLLGYLHDTEVLYFQNNLFINKIILDQAWAISAVYELLNRSNSYAELLRMENRFELHYQDIKKIWPKHSDQERELFMGFLVDAELCFVEKEKTHGNFHERIYSVPQLLSENRPDTIDYYINKEGLVRNNPKPYKLIPSSFIHRFIVRVQQIAEVNDLWQYGIYFTMNGQSAVVEINDSEDELIIHYPPGEEGIREFVLGELKKIKENIPFDLGEGERDGVREMIKWGWERSRQSDKNYKINLVNSNQQNHPNMEKKEIKIFVSYAHKDQNYFKVFAEEFGEQLKTSKKYQFSSFDDRQIIVGQDWNERLIKELESCQVGILLVSSTFLSSNYISEIELASMLERLETKENLVMFPVYFRPFTFSDLTMLSPRQFFKPDGSKYGNAGNDNFSFSNLVSLDHLQNGIPIVPENHFRDKYLVDLKKELEKAIDEKLGTETSKAEDNISEIPVKKETLNPNNINVSNGRNSKEEISQLINEDIGEALGILHDIFGKANGTFNDLYKEYINRPNNFETSSYRDRLKLFVRFNLDK